MIAGRIDILVHPHSQLLPKILILLTYTKFSTFREEKPRLLKILKKKARKAVKIPSVRVSDQARRTPSPEGKVGVEGDPRRRGPVASEYSNVVQKKTSPSKISARPIGDKGVIKVMPSKRQQQKGRTLTADSQTASLLSGTISRQGGSRVRRKGRRKKRDTSSSDSDDS